MSIGSGDGSLPGFRTRFNGRAPVAVAMSIVLFAGIASCAGGPVVVPDESELSSPANGAVGVGLTPTLNWTGATGATSYTLEAVNEGTLSPPLVYEKTRISAGTASFVVPKGVLAGGTTYYWRVTARDSAGSAIASNARFSFTVPSSGALVPGFALDGVLTSDPRAGPSIAFAVAVDPAAIYLVGPSFSLGDELPKWRIAKRGK